MIRQSLAILLAAATLMVGCSNILAPRPNRTRYFVLSPAPATEAQSKPELTVGIGPLEVPDYLNRNERAVSVGANQLRFLEDERWAEALDANIMRVLLQNSAQRLRNANVVSLPTFLDSQLTYQVPVHITRFESTEKGDASLEAQWDVLDHHDKVLFSGQSNITEPSAGEGSDAAVAALSRAVDRLSAEIVDAVVRARSTQPAAAAEPGHKKRAK